MRGVRKSKPRGKFLAVFFLLIGISLFPFSSKAATLTYYRYHIVRKGESLWEIGEQYSVSVKSIKKKNNLGTDRIYPRQKLIIPIKIKGIYHEVKKHEYLWRICKTYGVSMEEVVYLNNLSDPDHLVPGQKLFIPGASEVRQVKIPEEIIASGGKDTSSPHQQDIIQPPPSAKQSVKGKGFLIWPVVKEGVKGYEANNSGIDIFASEGTTVIAAAEGKVVFSGVLREFGSVLMKAILIRHKKLGLFTLYYYYMSNSINLVKKGDPVKQGEPIAKVGIDSSGEEIVLHLEVRRAKDGKSMDPLEYLPSDFE